MTTFCSLVACENQIYYSVYSSSHVISFAIFCKARTVEEAVVGVSAQIT
jgi:hypothetical protein